jgi:hypothetical protein
VEPRPLDDKGGEGDHLVVVVVGGGWK